MTKENTLKDYKKAPLEVFFPHMPESSRLLVSVPNGDFAASLIARAVEDADARLMNMNVTAIDSPAPGHLVVALRVGHRNPERVARSLERHGYSVLNVDSDGDAAVDDTLRRRYDELMHILEL